MTIPYRVHDSEYSNDIWKNHILTVLITLLKKKYLLLYNKRVIAWILVNIVPHSVSYSGADPGFQVRGGALKKIAPSGGRRENFGGISCEKSRFYAKKSYYFQLRREARKYFGVFRGKNLNPPLILHSHACAIWYAARDNIHAITL